MKTSNLGYPRIGENREWKKALEQYWAGDLEESALIEKVEAIRLNHLRKQKDSGIDLIPVNDFSYYDHVLDTAVMFGLVPERFVVQEKQPSLSTYYAMARGNVHAVAGEMTKWFNTNYHYIIPEFEEQKLVLTENKPLKAYLQAKEQLGIKGKPVILGPYTFIKLSKGYNEKQLPAIILQLLPLYIQLLKELEEAGVEWVQIDEPILVTDVSSDEMETVSYIYGQLQESLTSLKIMLQTYFDAVEHYEKVIKLPVQGIGLDFVHGRAKNIENIAKLPNLVAVDLSGNCISNLYSLQYADCRFSITDLNLSGNRLEDITPLSYLQNIERLDVSYNDISSELPFMAMYSLESLNLTGNPLTDEQVELIRKNLPNCDVIF